MKSILVLLHDDAGQEARLQAALDIARALDGHLSCLDVVQFPVVGGYMTPEGQAILLEDERTSEAENRVAIQAWLADEDVRWTMIDTIGEFGDCVARAAGLADLLVINRRLDSLLAPDMVSVATRIALESRKPIVAVAEHCRGFDVGGHALVAWDGSEPSMAALTGAVPLLQKAGSVSILEILGSSAGGAEEAAAYLSRHDIHAEVDLVAPFKGDGSGAAEIIRSICAQKGAAWCVMGAYGHSPLRETILGGVTRTMLQTSEVPLVLAH
jgi:nucleotide-binding universal stress UspA family protein